MERELRHLQSTLAITGLAVIFFGIWSIVKVVLLTLSDIGVDAGSTAMEVEDEEYLAELADVGLDSASIEKLLLLTLVVGLIIVAIDLLLRIYIGRSAIAEAQGKKKRVLYVILAFVLAGLSLLFTLMPVFNGDFLEDSQGIVSTVVTLIVDCTSNVTLLVLAITALRVRKMSKTMVLLAQKE